MKTLLITRLLPEANLAAARARYDVTLRTETCGLTVPESAAALAKYDAILPTLGDQFSADAFAGDIRCGVLANFGVGYNHIDVAAAKVAGVQVSNTPDVVTDATADIGMTLILATCRRAGEGERLVRANAWTGWQPTQMLGTHVTGKTVGIIGMGRIGQAVARRCHYGFDMPVIFFNRSRKSCDVPSRQVDQLGDLMAQADIIVVTVPGGGSNTNLIDAAALAKMKPTGVFVNIARGDVVDEEALIAALQAGRIAGAGLDVYAKEPVVPEALRALENAVLLPHLGTAALEVRAAMGQMALENINAWDDGKPLPQVV
ncbi:2-hydroxyacid dehydrogenase [Yoonia sediminilitoris]|uniref:Lactate dehydrogenase-like 2-hydroxyacid dehydrogenase n=1 Tax=Yoonia sediminilitoris TaxID=1286148 RepID=A0A2T6KB50_9RHOB|nr:D-glycerate dehydrogenase [Yoonia sediminilitoris]PUB12104.1 lactate dehydrogenase-like 2-hydroxyacid dehydrogenase [Yoonia sediminilitoris]RCW92931.1 lactate dehydrogenase-like 2-hydroxyacid dehydrogenase [Yoonia sediminilitoris]